MYTTQNFHHCCGVVEISLSELRDRLYTSDTTLRVAELISYEMDGKAGCVLTDNCKQGRIHRYLSKIVAPVYLGVNRSTKRRIHIWVIPKRVLIQFIKAEKAKLKAKSKK